MAIIQSSRTQQSTDRSSPTDFLVCDDNVDRFLQEVMGMKEKEPMMYIDEVQEVDIEKMSMEELREFIAAAEAEVIV